MFRRLSSLLDLYAFSRSSARFRLQTLLKGLPAEFLILRPSKALTGLPQAPEERLRLFLEQSGTSLQTLAFFFALHPEVAGSERAGLLEKSVAALSRFAESSDDKEKKCADRILKLFHILTEKKPALKELAVRFEKILEEVADFRFEAAALERLNDCFYEDECLKTLLPDWRVVGKDNLPPPPCRDLLSLTETPDKEKTASSLVKAVVLMILRDGFVIMPSEAACRVDDSGMLVFIRGRMSVRLSASERLFVSSFVKALISRQYSQAAKALTTAGYAPPFFPASRLTRLIEDTDDKTASLPYGQKADCFLKNLAENGVLLPFALRVCVFALKRTDELCLTLSYAGNDIWKYATKDFFDFLDKGKDLFTTARKDESDIRQTFALAASHTEQLEIQGRTPPAFQENPQKIVEILNRHTFIGRLRARPTELRCKLTVFILLTVCILSGLILL